MTLETEQTHEAAAEAAANMSAEELRDIGALVPNTLAMVAAMDANADADEVPPLLLLAVALSGQQVMLDRAFIAAGLGDVKHKLVAAHILGDQAAFESLLAEVAMAEQQQAADAQARAA